MIGVIARPDEKPFVSEFFELFKTPWTWVQPGTSCDVVLTTGERPSLIDARLVIVCSSSPSGLDLAASTGRRDPQPRLARIAGETIPLYGPLLTFNNPGQSIARLESEPGSIGCIEAANGARLVRLGYDLFREIEFLLSSGQPASHARYPALDLHIAVLRGLILQAGIPVVEIPPAPHGIKQIVCLTHDIDFLSLRQHKGDRTMWGFLYRSTVGSVAALARGRGSLRKLTRNCSAALQLPLVHLGLRRDFWSPFEQYLAAEAGRPSTFFVIPFKNREGQAPTGRSSRGRGVRYDVDDVRASIAALEARGNEAAVHGIDAWTDADKGAEERARLSPIAPGSSSVGVRMHWLFFDKEAPALLERAGYAYDSTSGYNEAVGFRAGTSQVFKPVGVKHLLELPMHIQDTALFYPDRMNLSESEAWTRSMEVITQCRKAGGVITVSWHDRSLAPERLWDAFYKRLLTELDSTSTWFATARDAVAWFRKRRQIRFAQISREDGTITIEMEQVPAEDRHDCLVRISWQNDSGTVSSVETPLKGRSELVLAVPAAPAIVR